MVEPIEVPTPWVEGTTGWGDWNNSNHIAAAQKLNELLLAIGDIPAGPPGETPALRTNSMHIQWQYPSEGAIWRNLVALADLKGADGLGGTITSITASSLAAGATPTVTLGGTAQARTIALGIPVGGVGSTGPAGQITAVTAVGLAAGASPTIVLGGTAEARTIQIGVPAGVAGTAGTITGATASALAAGATPTVVLGGTSTARTFAFGIPAGVAGQITSMTAVALAAGATPTVTLGGTPEARTIEIGIPSGPPGVDGVTPVLVGTSTSSVTIGSASRTFALDAPTSFVVGQLVRAAATASPTNYLAGNVTAVSPTSITILGSESTGTGTFSAWTLTLTGNRGAAGSTGGTPSFSGTSTGTYALATGAVNITTQSGKAWTAGQRVRVSSTAAPTTAWMEGVVTSYSSTILAVTVDRVVGTGSPSSWSIALTGDPGVDGSSAGATTDASGITSGVFDTARLGITGDNQLVGRNTGSTPVGVAFSKNATGNTVAQRDSTGKLTIADATADTQAVTLAQLNALLESRLLAWDAAPTGTGLWFRNPAP